MNKHKMNEINDWLDEPVVELTTDRHKPHNPDEMYYTPYELKKFRSKRDNMVHINIHTRRNDANNIFCELVDHCVRYNINDKDKDNSPLFNPSNKNSFYNFVYSNSSK